MQHTCAMTTQFQMPFGESNKLCPAYVLPRIRRRPFGLRSGIRGPGGIFGGSRATRVDGSRNGDFDSLSYSILIESGIPAGSSYNGSGRWGGTARRGDEEGSSRSMNHGVD